MGTILDEILEEKKKEVAQLHNKEIVTEAIQYDGPTFADRVRTRSAMAMIAEIKRASPSKGMINQDVDPVKQAKLYEANGVSAISVLTDAPFFKGSLDDLRQVRRNVNIPILCKDFIIDEIQIDHAKAAGANIILLIAAALDDERLANLYSYAVSLNLEVICEVHNEAEMERVLKLNPTLVGVNNRDLKTFNVDLSVTGRIAQMAANTDIILIGESGIKNQTDVKELVAAGAEAILIGETLMRAERVEDAIKELFIPLPEKARHR